MGHILNRMPSRGKSFKKHKKKWVKWGKKHGLLPKSMKFITVKGTKKNIHDMSGFMVFAGNDPKDNQKPKALDDCFWTTPRSLHEADATLTKMKKGK